VVEAIASRYLMELKQSCIDTLVLGCTHYPLLKGTISKVMGDGVRLIDSAVETAKVVKEQLEVEGKLKKHSNFSGRRIYFVTDSPERFKRIGTWFLGHEIEEIFKVEIGAGSRG